ncbi:MAG: PQQ-dependent sugar dehydrogenase [Nitrososphaeraceae archaeon]
MLLSFGFLVLLSLINLNLSAPISLPHADAVLLSSHPLTIQSPQGPTMNDSHLKAEVVFKGIKFPTSMAFLGPNDILVLEKNEGTVRRIVNGAMLQQPLLHVNVANDGERGLLGIAVSKARSSSNNDITTYVFLYYTELGQRKSGNISGVTQPAAGNRLYRYELVDNKLVNPKLLLDLPATPGPYHNGGKVVIGPDNNVYVVIGDVFSHRTKAQNSVNGSEPDGTSGILRITQDGKVVSSSSGANGVLGNKFPLNLYYAYGIRNSFGMDFDPLTGRLWDTENGPAYGDEINLVQPGFNSGWEAIQGIWRPVPKHLDIYAGSAVINPNNLVTFNGKGKYRSPEFIWYQPTGPTAIKFLNSTKLGKQYQNDIFVADFHQGNIYHFKLNQDRTGLVLNGSLANRRIANNVNDLKGVVFGYGFGGITDMQISPDGYLYVLSLYEGGNNCAAVIHVNTPCISYTSSLQGTIFRIVPTKTAFVR